MSSELALGGSGSKGGGLLCDTGVQREADKCWLCVVRWRGVLSERRPLGVGRESSHYLGMGQFSARGKGSPGEREYEARGLPAVMGDGQMVAVPGVCGLRGLTWWAGSARLTCRPPCHFLQEHPECLPGAGGHPGSEPRAATQVHHAGHGHHAEAGEAWAPGAESRMREPSGAGQAPASPVALLPS